MNGSKETSDADLLRLMRAGDQEAFRSIYRRSQGPIYRFALHMTGNASVAEDITQDVFMTLIQGTFAFDESRGALSAYLFGIGRKLLLRRLDAEKVFVPLVEPEAPDGSNHQKNGAHSELITLPYDSARRERIDGVRQAIFSLPVNYREVVVLCDLQDMSYEDAARVLDCAVGTVRSRLHRARSLLMEKLRNFREPVRKMTVGGEGNS